MYYDYRNIYHLIESHNKKHSNIADEIKKAWLSKKRKKILAHDLRLNIYLYYFGVKYLLILVLY